MDRIIQLGMLERVTIKDVWKDEAREFTPWLARDENMALLSEAVGFELEVKQTEFPIGEFRLDILARISGTDESVVIENQFGKTDHPHLGQLLTYAAGVGQGGTGASVVIWVAEHFAEPHRSTLDWLNKISQQGIRFFGIEIELWRIGQSLPAPKFNLISKPNPWQKAVTTKSMDLSSTDELYLEFWEKFRDYCDHEGTTLRLSSALPKYWQWSNIGRTGFGLNFTVSVKKKRMAAELYIDHNAAHKALALLQADLNLKKELGPETQFQKLTNYARIVRYLSCDISNRKSWPEMFAWLKKNGEEMKTAFQERVKTLPLDQTTEENGSGDA